MPNLYQSEWNGINLLEIARLQNTLTGGIPNQLFYAEYYKRLTGVELPESWKRSKAATSVALEKWLNEICVKRGISKDQLTVCSIGAGLGTVELPLIKKGYSITLHEVQEHSLEAAQIEASRLGISKLETFSGELSGGGGRQFDVLYLGTCEYCFLKEADYLSFLASLKGLLKKNGVLIAWDFMPSIKSYFTSFIHQLLKNRNKEILWGYARSSRVRARAWVESGLKIERVQYWDASWQKLLAESSYPGLKDFKLTRPTQAVLFGARA